MATTTKGAETRRALVDTAREQFVHDGYASFSLRRVARAVGVSLGHLQHFFPTKDDLVTAMLTEVTADYLRAYQAQAGSPDVPAPERLRAVLQLLVSDAGNPRTVSFFVELWAVCNHEDSAHRLLRDLYRRNQHSFAELIRDVRPDLDAGTAEEVALQVVTMVDGLIVFAHSDRPSPARFERMAQRVLETAVDVVARARPSDAA